MDDVCRRVLDEVDALADPMLGILRQLVEIPSISGTDAENEAIAAVAHIFADHGLDVDHWQIPLDEITARPDFPGVEVDRHEAWGLVGRLTGRRSGTGDAPTLMFNGHVDVVPPGDLQQWTTDPFDARVDGGRLFGRGSCDMKAGLVAALWATESIRRSGVQLRGDVLLAAVLGEEDGGLGTYSTLARGWTADACVIPEPTGLDLVPANAGALTFRLVVPGKAAHASRRTEGVSSIEKFLPVVRGARTARGTTQPRPASDGRAVGHRLPAQHRHGPRRRLGVVRPRRARRRRTDRRGHRRTRRARPRRARARGARRVRRRPVAPGPSGNDRMVGRAVREWPAQRRQRPARSRRVAPTPPSAGTRRRHGSLPSGATSA